MGKYLSLIKESVGFKSMFAISIYFLKLPLIPIYRFIGKKIKPKLLFNVTLKNKDGTFFCDRDMTSVWIASSLHETKMEKYFSLEEGVFIDIGANIGKYSIIVGKNLKGGVVVAIEPEPTNFEILKKNIKRNGLKNVLPINLACSDKNGNLDFYIDQFSSGGHSLHKKENFEKITVKAEKLDKILKRLQISEVNLIKIDVEGAETEVLRGATKILNKHHPRIIFEAWNERKLLGIKKILVPLNYKIKKIGEIDYLALENDKKSGNTNSL